MYAKKCLIIIAVYTVPTASMHHHHSSFIVHRSSFIVHHHQQQHHHHHRRRRRRHHHHHHHQLAIIIMNIYIYILSVCDYVCVCVRLCVHVIAPFLLKGLSLYMLCVCEISRCFLKIRAPKSLRFQRQRQRFFRSSSISSHAAKTLSGSPACP